MNPPHLVAARGETRSVTSILDALQTWLAEDAFQGDPTAILSELAHRFDAQCAGFSLPSASWPLFIGCIAEHPTPVCFAWGAAPQVDSHLRRHPRPRPHVDDEGSWLLVPMFNGPDLAGVLWLHDETTRLWSAQEQTDLSLVAAALVSLGGPRWRQAFEKSGLDQRLDDAAHLSGKLGHGFGNFLTGILGFTELSINEVAAQTTLHTYLQEVWQSATQGAQWVHLLQIFSRKLAINPLPTQVAAIVHEEAARLKGVWSQVLQFTADIPADLPPAAIDPDSLRKILAQILDNSCEAIRQAPGSVRLTARTKDLIGSECLELVGACRPGAYLEITIQDNGAGLTDEQRAKLFHEVFFSTKPRHRGMGLAVVYALLKAYQGGMRFRPGEQRGMITQIYLPRHLQNEAPRESTAADATILVVDTDAAVRENVTRLLQQNGAKVVAVGNPHDAYKAYTQPGAVFHLVLAEVMMPGMNGYDLAHRILERDPLANFLFVTDKPSMHGLANQDLARKYDLVRKPFDPPQFLQAIRASLRRGLRAVHGTTPSGAQP